MSADSDAIALLAELESLHRRQLDECLANARALAIQVETIRARLAAAGYESSAAVRLS